jgi:hypothetical protein
LQSLVLVKWLNFEFARHFPGIQFLALTFTISCSRRINDPLKILKPQTFTDQPVGFMIFATRGEQEV